jgi:hypothetical protein
LVPDEVRWARELWEHREPVSEIAEQLDVDIERVETLVMSWTAPQDSGERARE